MCKQNGMLLFKMSVLLYAELFLEFINYLIHETRHRKLCTDGLYRVIHKFNWFVYVTIIIKHIMWNINNMYMKRK